MNARTDQMHREYVDFIDDAYIHGSFDWIGYADHEAALQKIWEACQCHDLAERMARINQMLADGGCGVRTAACRLFDGKVGVMNHHEYRQIDAINWSSLKHMAESPMLYGLMLDHGRDDTPAFAFGRLVHSLVFEPALFNAECAIYEGERRAGKAWEEFKAANAGKTIYKAGEIDEAQAIAEAVRRHPLVLPYLSVPGQFEQPVVRTDMRTGLKCKARPDWIIPHERVLIDLKTCVSIDGRRFGAAAARYGYHCQLAHYAAGTGCANC